MWALADLVSEARDWGEKLTSMLVPEDQARGL